MKIALVEKQPSNIRYEKYFKFDFDKFTLINAKKTKILKADIDLDFEELEGYDRIVLIGAEPAKFIGKIGSVVKYAGHLVSNKYIPMFSPAMVAFKPEIKPAFQQAVDLLHQHIDGSYKEELGSYEAIDKESKALLFLERALAHENKYCAMDTETTALYPKDGYVLGISISYATHGGAYISSECITQEVEAKIQELCNTKTVVFHNAKFDIPFIWHRSVINQVEPSKFFKPHGRHNSDHFCTMEGWAGFGGKISLNNLAKILDLGAKTEGMDGSQVCPEYEKGNIKKIADYCLDDVRLTRKIYNKLTFNY